MAAPLFSPPPASSPPCAACKLLRRKCLPGCVFAPHFPADESQRFAHVHRVFGASNVAKLLGEISPGRLREDAAASLAYEAVMRLRDPVYGCAGAVCALQHQLRQVQVELARAQCELSKYQAVAAAAAGNSVGTEYGAGGGSVFVREWLFGGFPAPEREMAAEVHGPHNNGFTAASIAGFRL